MNACEESSYASYLESITLAISKFNVSTKIDNENVRCE